MRKFWHAVNMGAAQPMIWFVVVWRLIISPLYGPVCKYYPSCSAYGLESFRTHGAVGGVWLTLRRIGRCHPWASGGYDPVPKQLRHGHRDGGAATSPALGGHG